MWLTWPAVPHEQAHSSEENSRYCRGRKPWDEVQFLSSHPPPPLYRVTGISHLLIAKPPNCLSLGLSGAWKRQPRSRDHNPSAQHEAFPAQMSLLSSRPQHVPWWEGKWWEKAAVLVEKVRDESRPPCSALVHMSPTAAFGRKLENEAVLWAKIIKTLVALPLCF